MCPSKEESPTANPADGIGVRSFDGARSGPERESLDYCSADGLKHYLNCGNAACERHWLNLITARTRAQAVDNYA